MQQIPFIDLFKSSLHNSGDKLAHPQEHFLTVYTDFRTMHRYCSHRCSNDTSRSLVFTYSTVIIVVDILMKLEFSQQKLEKKMLTYQISWKSVRCEPSCCMRTGRYKEVHSRFSKLCEKRLKIIHRTFRCI
jgi:hypothetical protein